MSGSVDVERIRPDGWSTLRALRLRALAEDPGAFLATLAEEDAYGDDVWRQRAEQGAAGDELATFVARVGSEPAGLVVGRSLAEAPSARELVSMWTAPEHRRTGIGAALVDAVGAWAAGVGADRLLLWVMRGNDGAVAFYERLGFTPTNEPGAAGDPCRDEIRLVRRFTHTPLS